MPAAPEVRRHVTPAGSVAERSGAFGEDILAPPADDIVFERERLIGDSDPRMSP